MSYGREVMQQYINGKKCFNTYKIKRVIMLTDRQTDRQTNRHSLLHISSHQYTSSLGNGRHIAMDS